MTRATKRKASVPRASSRDGACACSRGVNAASGARYRRARTVTRDARGDATADAMAQAVVGDG